MDFGFEFVKRNHEDIGSPEAVILKKIGQRHTVLEGGTMWVKSQVGSGRTNLPLHSFWMLIQKLFQARKVEVFTTCAQERELMFCDICHDLCERPKLVTHANARTRNDQRVASEVLPILARLWAKPSPLTGAPLRAARHHELRAFLRSRPSRCRERTDEEWIHLRPKMLLHLAINSPFFLQGRGVFEWRKLGVFNDPLSQG